MSATLVMVSTTVSHSKALTDAGEDFRLVVYNLYSQHALYIYVYIHYSGLSQHF